MADMENEEDLFADLYDGEADEPAAPTTTTTAVKAPSPEPAIKTEAQNDSSLPDASGDDFNIKTDYNEDNGGNNNNNGLQQFGGGGGMHMDHNGSVGGYGNNNGGGGGGRRDYSQFDDGPGDRPIHIKDDG
ncbi:hypothetical protein LTR97_003318 [Elasticomyces elasticus]|uniref:Uncharacterized protein n=1 Tax=Elasticomyces elasticus TaxID=574655 RepID=A0AAN7WE92_9PEZI|nr:hypothetical protein LTR97_003318 [Elasticomyces elasticus]